MNLGQVPRPRDEPEPFNDFEPRRKCSICCGLRCAAVTGGALFLIVLPCNLIMIRGRIFDGRGFIGFADRHLLVPLPFAAITFTHQIIQSEALWSKNRKTLWQVNTQSAGLNILLWSILTVACTAVSRRQGPRWSRSYRLLLWDYRRTRRCCANRYLPTAFGRISADLDWYNVLWTVSVYHVLWGMFAVMVERGFGAHYAMFYRDWPYSRWCSPRWREWRELEAMKYINTEQVVAPSRWGSFITNDRWRSSSV
ncbi:hypothetical protein, conserved [Trypanosoma brucei gambiense DAL972]|uniref:Uncharacterized protein n=1 Tax=Trypanosoma brucei gambiense (strain MHOM/CI/86/DAL972) TaxID=679716 RepID=D0A0N4_TRYB9|nr:hypothetical protein, conserved [Trypanosoma brucei gambiense DAL972]CBH16792.1 hypothetical protein, conserved [Trypanosoma brucei gambiense DAL972]|eukprot:XP_011779056.1 hypothetical protein, conserved [Trypanosoma brucei gambiense DAL972]